MKPDAFIQHILDVREKAMLEGRDIERIYISEKMADTIRSDYLERMSPKSIHYFDYEPSAPLTMIFGMYVTAVKDKELHYLDFKYRIPRMTGVC